MNDSTFNVCDTLVEFQRTAESIAYSRIRYGSVEGFGLDAFESPRRPGGKRVYLSSGIHGDEPAGPLALLELLKTDSLPDSIEFTLCPIINPVGLEKGSRENGNGCDLNRDFFNPAQPETQALVAFLESKKGYDLSICLHEDWEATGFYLYCLGDLAAKRIAEDAITAIGPMGPIDRADQIDGFASADGVIYRPKPLDFSLREDWPEAFYLCSKSQHMHFTLETPSAFPLEQRIRMQALAVRTILRRFLGSDALAEWMSE